MITPLVLAVALAAQDPIRRLPADAYADPGAADLVRRARPARERAERLVTHYAATVSERIGVGLRALARDRMLFHRELLARIEWYRDRPSRLTVLGARQGVPVVRRGDEVPDDLEASARDLALNPGEDNLRLVGVGPREGWEHPLKEGSEADYRFASGDTTRITLPGGRTLQLLELKVIPRRDEFRLISGSLWFDGDSYGLVRAVFRPARPFDIHRDLDSTDRTDVPSWLSAGAEVRYVTLEYGLYETRWWMPRYLAIDLQGTLGRLAGFPVRWERVYSDYEVEGGTPPPAGSTFRPAGSARLRPTLALDSARQRADSLRRAGGPAQARVADSLLAWVRADSIRLDSLRSARRACLRRERDSLKAEARRHGEVRIQTRGSSACFPRDSSLVVLVPEDTASLLARPGLGPPILNIGDVISENELAQLGSEIAQLSQQPRPFRARLPEGVGDVLSRLRYNRVEALSFGTLVRLDMGRARADVSARIGLADLAPGFELGLSRPAELATYRVAAYRRLAAANPELNPLGLGNSLSALVLQRDDGEYFRTLGLEITGQAASGWYAWRAYGERQRAAGVNTEVALPHLFSAQDTFRTNIAAQPADQFGAALDLHGSRALSRGLVLAAQGSLDAATGTFGYARGSFTLRSTLLPPGPLAFAVAAGAGSSVGTVPVQSRFFLGGPPTLRGYDGGAFQGDAFWRGRFEVGTATPAARLTLFGDVGWAGARSGFATGRARWGGGIGASFLDGLIRADLARAFSAPRGWRLDLYVDGIL